MEVGRVTGFNSDELVAAVVILEDETGTKSVASKGADRKIVKLLGTSEVSALSGVLRTAVDRATKDEPKFTLDCRLPFLPPWTN